MKNDGKTLTRREFLRMAGAGMVASFLPVRWGSDLLQPVQWPRLETGDLPQNVGEILGLVPRTAVDAEGFVRLVDSKGRMGERVILAQTQWNKENNHRWDRLKRDVPWGIVLHWYGDREGFNHSIAGYLNGFDSLRETGGYITRTSAHFLVGEGTTGGEAERDRLPFGILQTQVPDKDGTPFSASHLQPLDIQAHLEKREYFVRAYYQLARDEPAVHSLLQDFYDGPYMDPNMRTIAIEICGFDFDNPHSPPPPQQIANVLSLVLALMKRYRIPASNILGHHEIQLNKADPGKKFMALIRYLVGLSALMEDGASLKALTFAQYMDGGRDLEKAVQKYFEVNQKYLALTSVPKRVFEWELASSYWLLYDRLFGNGIKRFATELSVPFQGVRSNSGWSYLHPHNHEGIDLSAGADPKPVAQDLTTPVALMADGVCLFQGLIQGTCRGKTAIFSHFLPSGAQILSIYSHLDELYEVEVGKRYPLNTLLGAAVKSRTHPADYLHFALAYGSSWETFLANGTDIPLNVGETWIGDRFMNPLGFLKNWKNQDWEVETMKGRV